MSKTLDYIADLERENRLLKSLLYCTKRSCNNCGKVNCENFQRQRIDCCGLWVSYKDYINELEQELETERSSRIALVNKIEELEKEKAELKSELTKKADTNHSLVEQMAKLEKDFRICEHNADTYYDQLTKTKEIIKNIIRVTWGEGWNYSLDWKVKAEQFLKEIEKCQSQKKH